MLIKKIVGVEITDKYIRAVEVLGSEKSHKITATGYIDLPEGIIVDGIVANIERVAEMLGSLWANAGFKSSDVFYGVDNKFVLVRFADINAIVDKDFNDAVVAQVQNFLPVAQNTVELDFIPIDSKINEDGKTITKTIVVAAGKKMIGDFCSVFKKSGLSLIDIDVNNLVVSRLIPVESDDDKGVLFINFKKEMMNLLVIKNGKPLLARNIAIDTNEVLNENEFVQKYLKEVGKDIVASLAYYNSETDEFIDRVYITGYGVWNEEMVYFIKETANTNVTVINPFMNDKNKGEQPNIARPFEFSVAYSLAIRGLEGDK